MLSTSALWLRNPAVRVAVFYVLISSLWIWLSDRLVEMFVHDVHAGRVQTYKGWLFVLVTGVLLGLLVRRDLRRIEQSEANLREREARLRLAAAAGNVGIWEWDIPSGRLLWNDEIKAIFGLPADTAVVRVEDFVRAIHPADRETALEAPRRAAEAHTDYAREYRILRPDGQVRWIMGRGRAEYDAADRPVRIIGAALDVTESRRAEEAVRESESKFRSIVEQSLVGVYIIQNDRFVYVNPRMTEIFGYPQEEFLALHDLYETVLDEDRPRVQGHIRRRVTGESTSVHYHFRARRKDGSIIVVEVLGNRIEYGGLPAILGTLMDVTQQKRAETALRESEERFRLLFEQNPVPMWVYEVETLRFLAVNSAAVEHYGYSGNEFLTLTIRNVHPAEEVPALETFLRESGAGPARSSEWRHCKKDGTLMNVVVHSHQVDFFGRAARLVAVHDITERKQMEEAMRQLSGQLLHLQDEERRRLARELHDTSAQHIAALTLSLAVLQKMLPPDNPRAEKLCQDSRLLAETAAQEIRTMSYLLHPPLLDAVGLAGAIREYAAGFAQRSGIELDVVAPEQSLRLAREVELALFRICQEGLSNIHRHSGSARATIRLAFNENWVKLELQDAGNGIPREKLALITERKAALGVGIAGMRERMRQLGGQLEILSGQGGTIVRATVPVKAATNKT